MVAVRPIGRLRCLPERPRVAPRRRQSFSFAASVLPFRWNLFVTLRGPRDAGNNARDAHALKWATTNPPPLYDLGHLLPSRSEQPLFNPKYGHAARRAIAADSTAVERAHS